MQQESVSEKAPGSESRAAEPEAAEELTAELKAMIHSSSDMVRDFLELLAVEGRLAGRSLAAMLMLAIVLALLVVATWLFLAVSIALLLIDQGVLSPPMALLATAGANALLALAVWLVIRRLSGNLAFREFIGAVGSILPGREGKGEHS